MDLDGPYRRHRTYSFPDPFRIVTDLYPDETGAPAEGKHSSAPPRSSSEFDSRPVRRVVIDPGHGGKDPGAIGTRGTREKDVVLRVALRVRRDREEHAVPVHHVRAELHVPHGAARLLYSR